MSESPRNPQEAGELTMGFTPEAFRDIAAHRVGGILRLPLQLHIAPECRTTGEPQRLDPQLIRELPDDKLLEMLRPTHALAGSTTSTSSGATT